MARWVGIAVALVALGSVLPAVSEARAQTFHLRYGPVDLKPAELKWSTRPVDAPPISGFITRMHAFVTDRRGRQLASTQVMLHHAVFRRVIKPRWDQDCARMRDAEPFYATGEENETLRLPDGFGISTRPGPRWRVRWMLMNHTDRRQRVFISYTVRVDRSPSLRAVVPLWLRVVDCDHDQFRVPGGGGPGSVFTQGRTIAARAGGWIVAATGHLHAGALGLSLSQPACGGRELIKTQPVYATSGLTPTDGPVHVTGFASTPGIPVAAGEPLSLTATYDNSIVRDDVMGTMHVYLLPVPGMQETCPPLPGAH